MKVTSINGFGRSLRRTLLSSFSSSISKCSDCVTSFVFPKEPVVYQEFIRCLYLNKYRDSIYTRLVNDIKNEVK